MIRRILRDTCGAVQELAPAFHNSEHAWAAGTSKAATAARLLSHISAEVTHFKTEAAGLAWAGVRAALTVDVPRTLDEVRRYCEAVNSALWDARWVLNKQEYNSICKDALLSIQLVITQSSFSGQWHQSNLDTAGRPRLLHDRLAETARAIRLLLAYSVILQPPTGGTTGAFSAGAADKPAGRANRKR